MRKIRPDDPRKILQTLPKQVHNIDPTWTAVRLYSFFCFIKSPHSTAHVTCILNYFACLFVSARCHMLGACSARCCAAITYDYPKPRLFVGSEMSGKFFFFRRKKPARKVVSQSQNNLLVLRSLMNRNIFHKLFKRKITFLFDLLFSWFRQLAANYLWADFLFCLVAGGTKNENSVSRQNVVAPNFSFSLRQVLIKSVSRNVKQIADSSINLRFSLRLVEASSTRARFSFFGYIVAVFIEHTDRTSETMIPFKDSWQLSSRQNCY